MATQEEIRKEVKDTFGFVPTWFEELPPEGLEGFWSNFRDFHFAETNIPNKYKELIGLAVSGATRCHYCTMFHTEAARLHGATDEEIAEASYMAGWTMHSSTFLNAHQTDFETFKKETLQAVENIKSQLTH
jgi:AhpD family alkylhydroperoxidase